MIRELVELAREVGAEITLSMDSTCVNVQTDNSFICTPDFNTREENIQMCINWLRISELDDHEVEHIHPCYPCEEQEACEGCKHIMF
jgi:hypothetical protein